MLRGFRACRLYILPVPHQKSNAVRREKISQTLQVDDENNQQIDRKRLFAGIPECNSAKGLGMVDKQRTRKKIFHTNGIGLMRKTTPPQRDRTAVPHSPPTPQDRHASRKYQSRQKHNSKDGCTNEIRLMIKQYN